MEYIYPEIALKQPKADPRTVLLYKRNFMESSSDHIQEEVFRKETSYQQTTTAKCDKLTNLCKNSSTATRETTLVFKKSLASSLHILSKTSSSLLYTNLVNFSKSCHFNASFNNLHKLQKTKFLFFLIFIWCAIFLQTTQAIPVRRTTTSGRKLILHTNVYRERYHQKLLEERKQHNQHQQILQIQQQELQEIKEQQELQQQQQQQLQELQQLQQVQRNHIYSPTKILRRVPPQHHRHHLHQRAAPSAVINSATSTSQTKNKNMSYCNGNSVYENLHKQMNNSLSVFTSLCKNYLEHRGNTTFGDMSQTWNLRSLETRNPNRKSVSMDNKLHQEIHEFYLNIHNFDQLIDYASQDTNDNKTRIEHDEEISINKIIDFFNDVKKQIRFNMLETNHLMDKLEIEKPDLNTNVVEFNNTMDRRVRDFLIIKNLIEEFERVTQIVNDFCKNYDNNNGEE